MKSCTRTLVLGLTAFSGITAAMWYFKFKSKSSAEKIASLMLDILKKSYIHIKDKELVESKLKKLIDGGSKELQVIADFDRTLSKYKHDGRYNPCCHNVLETSNLMPDFYVEQCKALLDTYYPIEVDAKMTIPEKVPYMVEWWTKHHDLLIRCNLRHDVFKQIVKGGYAILREGCNDMFNTLYKHEIPLLIFSAGIGDVIEESIKQQSKMYQNMKIVSNYMDFNHQGILVGFKGELVHTFNKNENAIHRSSYFEQLKHRHNVILLGDSMGDLRMAEGVENANVILKIGFLNDKIEERLETYCDAWDIVLVSDESMQIPQAILKQIL